MVGNVIPNNDCCLESYKTDKNVTSTKFLCPFPILNVFE